jgi:hypothetical protein
MAYDRRDWDERQVDILKREIADRLRSVCPGVPDDEFEQLVERIARVQRKYEQRRTEAFFPNIRDVTPRDPTA